MMSCAFHGDGTLFTRLSPSLGRRSWRARLVSNRVSLVDPLFKAAGGGGGHAQLPLYGPWQSVGTFPPETKIQTKWITIIMMSPMPENAVDFLINL